MNLRDFFHRHTFVALLLGSGCLWSASRLKIEQPFSSNATQYQLSASFFKWVTGGFWPAAVDALWIQTLQKVSADGYTSNNLAASREFYRLATDLDPVFYELYEQAGVLFLFYYEAPEPAREILEKGIRAYEAGITPSQFWTHPYTLYIFLANVYAFQMNDWPKAKETYLRAALVPRAPHYLVQMQSWLKTEGSEKILAQRVLRQLIDHTDDAFVRSKYEEKLKKL